MGRMALGLLLALFLWPGLSAAQVNPDAFEVDTIGQLLQACTWSESDPLHVRMVTFCLGYVSSAIQYDTAVNNGDRSRMITCPPRARRSPMPYSRSSRGRRRTRSSTTSSPWKA